MIDLRALARRLSWSPPGAPFVGRIQRAWDRGSPWYLDGFQTLRGDRSTTGRPVTPLPVSVFVAALATLLVGYMFMGRGFAHLGRPPLYVGEIVLILGVIATGYAFIRSRLNLRPLPITWLLIGFMALGLARTIPYLGTFGFDALRDAVLWGYATFALLVFVLADRALAAGAVRLYGWVVPVFALWLPIAFYLFLGLGASIDPNSLGSDVPLVFFKSGDMAVHITGSIAFLVLVLGAVTTARAFIWRALAALPLLWIAFVAGATNRGGLLAVFVGLGVVATLAFLMRRSRNWLPILVSPAVLTVFLVAQGMFSQSGAATPPPTPMPNPVVSVSPTTSLIGRPTPAPSDTILSQSASAEHSLVDNFGFEVGPLNEGTIEGWITHAGRYNIVRGNAYEGSNYASVQNTGDPWTATITSSRFPVTAGHDISVSAWVKAVDGRPRVAIFINWFDSSGSRISEVGMTSLETDGLTTWKEAKGFLSAPAGTTDATVQLYEAAGRGTIAIDEVIVKAGDFIVELPAGEGRPATIGQLVENITSIFTDVSDEGLEGTKRFRVRWWTAIVNYTVFGEHFWTGKGFGVNLADADGFQTNADGSLRAPHNSHMTVLARMGVPGFALWLLVMGAFVIGLVRSVLVNRQAGDTNLAAVSAWILAYWAAMMVNTSFDPYLEGPQGGIWFWCLFGLGMVVMRLTPRRR